MKIPVRVSLIDKQGQLTFRARIEGLGSIEDPNIQALHERVEEALSHHCAANLGCVWHDWLKVSINTAPWEESRSDLSCGLAVQVERVKYGVDPSTGKAYTLSDSGAWAVPVASPRERAEDMARFFPNSRGAADTLTEKVSESYVPATPENIAAIEALRQRMGDVRRRLIEALKQDSIAQTLAKAGLAEQAILALPGAASKGERP